MEINGGKISLNHVHPHWRFKKPESSLLSVRNDLITDAPALENDDLLFYRPVFAEANDDLSDLPDVDDLLREPDEMNPPIPADDSDEDDDLGDLLDVNEPNVVKPKGRPPGSKNKKGVMTRAEKKAAKSTKRDLSGFEHAELAIETRAKRQKKEEAEAHTSTRSRDEARGARGARGGREARGGRRRGGATTSTPMAISSDEDESDDGFQNLESSDEEFQASKHGDEEVGDEWMD